MQTMSAATPTLPSPTSVEQTVLRDTAQRLEAHFLSEMLKAAGLHERSAGFTSSQDEAQFSSFLRDAQARQMAEAGGIGLAESFFQALSTRADR